MTAKSCPSRETLHQYSLGLLADGDRESLDSHLDSCPDCQAAIATLDDADDTLIGRLRAPLSSEAVLAEPQLQDALAAAIAGAAAVGAAVELPPQQTADMPESLGEYRILKELGSGGMGRVFKALHTKLDRVVAIKVLPHGRGGDQRAIDRFAREMRAVGPLMHPNIVQAYDAREIDGTPVLVMEFVDGLDLAEIVRRLGPLPAADACELARQTALALQCAHEHGLVHRDVKPSNVMLARSGEVKLLDLGLARLLESGDSPPLSAESAAVGAAVELPSQQPHELPSQRLPLSSKEMTAVGQAMGTADYMAPEQAFDSRNVDIRADLYSLGCTLYKLLSGHVPFGGPECRTTLEKFNAHAHQPPASIRRLVPNVPEGLAVLLDRLLAKNPADRPAAPAEVAEALARWSAGADLPALLQRAIAAEHSPHVSGQGQGAGSSAPQALAAGRSWRSLIAVAVVMFLLGGGLGFYLGITIRIQKDGRNYELEVPPGSHTTVGENGSATVRLSSPAKNAQRATGGEFGAMKYSAPPAPASKYAAPPAAVATVEARPGAANAGSKSAASPAAEMELLKGKWNVLNIEKGSDADNYWGAILSYGSHPGSEKLLPDLHELVFNQWGSVLFFSSKEQVIGRLACTIDPSATPKRIEVYHENVSHGGMGGESPLALGIYKSDGKHLVICFTRILPWVKTEQRPMRFAVEPGSSDILLTLERPAGDERAIVGHWKAISCIEDGHALLAEEVVADATYREDSENEFYIHLKKSGRRGLNGGPFALDQTRHPKRIIIRSSRNGAQWSGIYELDGDRLTLAYRQNGPSPQEFESKPGSGVVLLVLQRGNGPRVTASPAETAARMPTPNPSKSVFMGGWQVTDANLEHFQGLAGVESLNLSYSNVTDAGLKRLEQAKNLESLDLSFAKVTDAGLENIEGLTKLQSLSLHGIGLTDAGLEHLKGLTQLRSLDLTFAKITDAGLARLRCFPELRSLDLSGVHQISDAGMKHVRALDKLESLTLTWSHQIGDAGLENLKGLPHLQTLKLGATSVSPAGLEYLKGLPNLRTLELGKTAATDAGCERLKALPQLESLYLEDTELTDAGLKTLGAMKQLRFLRLWASKVSRGGLADLARALPGCRVEAGSQVVRPQASGQPDAPAQQRRESPPIVVPVGPQRPGPRVGWLAGCAGVELLAIGDGRRWWQPSGVPLAGPPCPIREASPPTPEPDFTRRAFFVRVTGVPLEQWGTNFQVVPSSGSDDRIAYQDIQKVPSRSYFSGVETGVPNNAKTVALRWGFSMGPWEDAALVTFAPGGRPMGPGSRGERLNSLQVLEGGNGVHLELPYQPQYEERAMAIPIAGPRESMADFFRRRDREYAYLQPLAAKDISVIKLQRRPYAWVEFRGVPTQWSETPIRIASVSPDACNVAAQPQGPWIARLSNGAVKVQLVGVGDDDRWWQPNGALLTKPPCQFNSKAADEGEGLVRRRFFLRLSGLPSSPAGITGNVAPGVAPGTRAAIPEHVLQAGKEVENRVNFLAFEAFVPKTSRTITAVTCGVATGPWQEFASPSVNYYPDRNGGFSSGGESIGIRNIGLQIHKDKDGVEAAVTDGWFNTDDLRLVAITYDGRALTGRAWIDHPKRQQVQTIIRATFPGVTLAEIKKLNVERRPYEWVCFSYAAAAPETAAKPEAAKPSVAEPTARGR